MYCKDIGNIKHNSSSNKIADYIKPVSSYLITLQDNLDYKHGVESRKVDFYA